MSITHLEQVVGLNQKSKQIIQMKIQEAENKLMRKVSDYIEQYTKQVSNPESVILRNLEHDKVRYIIDDTNQVVLVRLSSQVSNYRYILKLVLTKQPIAESAIALHTSSLKEEE